jgi:hypothetical protein
LPAELRLCRPEGGGGGGGGSARSRPRRGRPVLDSPAASSSECSGSTAGPGPGQARARQQVCSTARGTRPKESWEHPGCAQRTPLDDSTRTRPNRGRRWRVGVKAGGGGKGLLRTANALGTRAEGRRSRVRVTGPTSSSLLSSTTDKTRSSRRERGWGWKNNSAYNSWHRGGPQEHMRDTAPTPPPLYPQRPSMGGHP